MPLRGQNIYFIFGGEIVVFERIIKSWYLLKPEKVEAYFRTLKPGDPKKEVVEQVIISTDLELASNPNLRKDFAAEVREARKDRELRLGGLFGRLAKILLPKSPRLFGKMVFFGNREEALPLIREFEE